MSILPIFSQEIPVAGKDDHPAEIPLKPFHYSFVYPLDIYWIHSPEFAFSFSFNLLGGYTGGLKGVELSSLFNIDKYYTKGVQIAGLFNISGNSPGIYNNKNVQIAGLFNQSDKGKSVQIAGMNNVADTTAFQLSGIINKGRISSTQLTGLVNVAKEGIVQIAGLTNIANQSKCQIGGVNITKQGYFQIGVVNVRDTANGVSLGLINIARKGARIELGIEASEYIHTSLTFRSGTRYLYSILSGGYNYSDKIFSLGGGLGTSFPIKERIGIDLELMYLWVKGVAKYSEPELPSLWDPFDFYTDFDNLWKEFDDYYDHFFDDDAYNSLIQLRPIFYFNITKYMKIYAGPTFNLLIQDAPFERYNLPIPYSIIQFESMYGNQCNFWIGGTGGINFTF